MIATLFIVFVALMAALVLVLVARCLTPRTALGVLAVLSVWFIYVGLLAYFGVTGNTHMRPPGVTFLLVPVLLFLLGFLPAFIGSAAGARVALAFPIWILLAAESFRVAVELFLHQLWIDGVVPKMLTFAGANVDIYVGLSAPLVAWFATKGRVGRRVAFWWNVLGLLALTNAVVRAVLTTPGPLNLMHAEIPNRLIGTFPFTLIPGFFVPLAVVLHLLALRALATTRHPLADHPGPLR